MKTEEAFEIVIILTPSGELELTFPPRQHIGALGILELAKAHIIKETLPEARIIPGPALA